MALHVNHAEQLLDLRKDVLRVEFLGSQRILLGDLNMVQVEVAAPLKKYAWGYSQLLRCST